MIPLILSYISKFNNTQYKVRFVLSSQQYYRKVYNQIIGKIGIELRDIYYLKFEDENFHSFKLNYRDRNIPVYTSNHNIYSYYKNRHLPEDFSISKSHFRINIK